MSYNVSNSQRKSRQGFNNEESSPVNTENDEVSRIIIFIKLPQQFADHIRRNVFLDIHYKFS